MKKADLTPPLGYPGGPCHVVKRIRQEVRDPRLREKLDDQVETGKELSNPEANQVYTREVERGPGGVFKHFEITPHAQYRMDLRGIVITEIRIALMSFLKMLNDSKSRGGWEYRHYTERLSRGEVVEWADPKIGLFIAFSMPARETVRIVTTYWKGEKDPPPPGLGSCRLAYTQPVHQLPGTQTYVQNPDGTQNPSPRKQPSAPLPERGRVQVMPPAAYSKPDAPTPRTIGVPGDRSPPGNEPARSTPSRRPDVMAASRVATRWLRSLLREPPDYPYENHLDRATDRKNYDQPGGDVLDISPTVNNPRSAKVIPSGHGFVNKEGFVRIAVRISDIQAACGRDLWDKARKVQVRLKRVDTKNSMWHFSVKGSKDDYLVRVQAQRRGNVKDMAKVDVLVACTCPFWQWQGPEHWARQQGYLYGKAVGTASKPVEKDPDHKHGACKHILAAFDHILRHGWQVPEQRGKTASGLRYLADTLTRGEVWVSVRRYRSGQDF